MFYTYILESPSGAWYHTSDLADRLYRHNSNQSKATRNKGPWVLIFQKGVDTKGEAARFELHLKRLRNKNYVLSKYAEYFIGAVR